MAVPVRISHEKQVSYDAEEQRAMNGEDDLGYKVELYIYDLSRGLARSMSSALLGRQIEGVWHTGVVAYGREYFFGSGGIESCRPGGTLLGDPDRIEDLGESQVPYQLFLEYIFGLGESSYRPGDYDLLTHNCNNFSDELANFLCGRGIPKNILQLPDEVLSTPLGDTLSQIAKNLELKNADSRTVNFGNFSNSLNSYVPSEVVCSARHDPELEELNDAIEQVRHNTVILEDRRNSLNEKLSKKEKKERKKEKKERKEKKKKSKSTGDTSDEGQRKRRDQCWTDENQGVTSVLPSLPVVGAQEESEQLCDNVNSGTGFLFSPQLEADSGQDSSQPPVPSQLNGTSPLCFATGSSFSQLDTPTADFPHLSLEGTSTEAASMEDFNSEEMPSSDPQIVSGGVPSPLPGDDDIPEGSSEPEVEREPPILYTQEVDTREELESFVRNCGNMLSAEEQQHVEDLRSYVVDDDGSWALGENFNILFARVFHDPEMPEEAQHHLVRIMAAAALKDDVILLLHQDRKEHTIMNFANRVESLSPNIQEALALFFCNMFQHLSPSEWLLYISEWTERGQQISNIRVTTKVAVNALLHASPKVQDYGTALMYNLGTKEVKTVVFDDVAPELAMAILQYFNSNPPEEQLWRTMTALCRFCYASTEVPALIKMIGPDPSSFQGTSSRIDVVIEEISVKLSRVRDFC